jgi:hypothetical protein
MTMSDSTSTPATDTQAMAAQLQRLTTAMDRQALDSAIHDGAAGVAFASDAARDQAHALLRQHLRVNDGAAVSADGKRGAEFVREALGRPEYRHFRRAGHNSGGSLPGGHQPPASSPDGAAEPRTMGEHVIMKARQAQQERQAPANPSTNMRAPFGLRQIR